MTKRIVLSLLILSGSAFGQWTASASGSSVAAAEINSKPAMQTGVGAPTGLSCTLGKDFYTDTSTGDLYKATVTGGPGGCVFTKISSTGIAGPGYAATSSTTFTPTFGSTSFATQSGLAYTVGARARASSTTCVCYVEGLVTSYSGSSLVINVDVAVGSSSSSSWNINLTGNVGLQGATGSTGATGGTGPTGSGYGATSTTSLAIGTGSATFATQAGLAYSPGVRARASSAANTANYMEGLVTGYSGTTLVVNVDTVGGSGTKADWNLNASGNVGATGGAVGGSPLVYTTSTSLSCTTNNLITALFNGVSLTATIPTAAGCPATTKLIVANAAATTLSFTLATQVNGSGTLAAMPAFDATKGGYTAYVFEVDPSNAANWQMRGPNQGASGGGGGGGAVTRGTVGAGGSGLPTCTGACSYFGTDASTVSMYDGSSWWHTWNGLAGISFPVLANFTQANFSTATATQQGPFVALAGTATSPGSPRLLVKALPSTPYAVISCFRGDLNQRSQSVGMMLTTSATFGTGNTEQIRLTNGDDTNFRGALSPVMSFGYYQNLSWTYTGVSTDFHDVTIPVMPGSPICFGVEDDGTNKKLAVSRDGINFTTFLTEAHTGYITATNIAVFVDSDTVSCSGCAATIPHALWVGYKEYSSLKW